MKKNNKNKKLRVIIHGKNENSQKEASQESEKETLTT